jgi:C_GCAxxG_C_C family probable redox protein
MGVIMSKEERANLAYQLAYDYDLNYGSCPQCVIRGIMEAQEEDLSELMKASHTLSGGGGLAGRGTCGALAGGLLVLGHYYGRDIDSFEKGRFLKSFLKGKELMEKFQLEFGGISCDDLKLEITGIKFDMWDTEEASEFKELAGTKCAEIAGTVAKWIVEMID